MRNIRRIGMLGVSVIAAAGLAGGTAYAQASAQAEQYKARAQSQALHIELFGTTITTSTALAEVELADGTKRALGEASEVILPDAIVSGAKAEQSGGDGTVEQTGEGCEGVGLDAIPGVGRLDIQCAHASATIAGNDLSAKGLGAQVIVDASASELLATLQLQEPVQGAVDQTYEQVINPLVEAIAGNPVGDLVDSTTATLQDVLNGVLQLETTARVVIAPALAEVATTADAVTAGAHAQGVRIELLPVNGVNGNDNLLPDDLVPGEPLITITIGDAKAQSVYNRGDGTTTHDATGALAVIELGTTALLDTLGLSSTRIEVGPGDAICLLEGTPLESCIAIASASTSADGARADGFTVSLFRGVEGGVNLAAGTAETGATGSPAVAEQPEPAAELPRTGGPAVLPIAGAGMLALALATRRLAGRRSS